MRVNPSPSRRRPSGGFLHILFLSLLSVWTGGCVSSEDVAEELVHQGNAARSSKDLQLAAEKYTQAMEACPESTWALWRRAELYEEWEKYELALSDYFALLKEGNSDSHRRSIKGLIGKIAARMKKEAGSYTTVSQYDEALAAAGRLEESVGRQPGGTSLLGDLTAARSFLAAGRLRVDLDETSRALEADPKNPDVLLHRAMVLLAIDPGNAERALKDLDAAVLYSPKDVRLHLVRGDLFKTLYRMDDAEVSYDRVLAMEPDHARANYEVGIRRGAAGHYDQSIPHFDRAIRSDPGVPEYWGARAFARMQVGVKRDQMDQLIADCDKWIALTPESRWKDCSFGYIIRAGAKMDKQQWTLAREDLFAYDGKTNSPHPIMHYLRGRCFRMEGRPGDALYSFNKAVEAGYQTSALYYESCLAWCDDGNVERAQEEFAKALKLDPGLSAPDWSAVKRRAEANRNEAAERARRQQRQAEIDAAQAAREAKARAEREEIARINAKQAELSRSLLQENNRQGICTVCGGTGWARNTPWLRNALPKPSGIPTDPPANQGNYLRCPGCSERRDRELGEGLKKSMEELFK